MKYGGGQICVQWNLGNIGTRHFVSTLGPGIFQHIGTRHFVREVVLSLEVKNVLV